MLRKLLLLLVLTIITSCSFKTINYSHDFSTFQKGIDFTQTSGEWLLNTMNLPEQREGSLEKIAYDTFSDWTGKKVVKKVNMKDNTGKKYSFAIPYQPTKEEFTLLSKTTPYKYLINIHLGSDQNGPRLQESEIFIDLYDIDNHKLMVSERVIGVLDKVNGNDIGNSFKVDVIPNMMSKLLRKGLKNIEKNSKF
ncbi:hypothetical protein [Tenacibaculum amylolyticum]|uniref:hypothetical protein n=1 Tax=Tenacibaculum amylolyticum TaxID=104269 RepID=UPI0038936D6E